MRRGLACLLVAASGCAGADAMTAPPRPTAQAPSSEAGLNAGEMMTFEVRLGGLLAGDAQLAVGQIGNTDGHRNIVVKSRAATGGAAALIKHIVDEATTTIDLDTGRPLQLDTVVETGDKRATASATFTGSKAEITYTRSDDPKPHKTTVDFGKVTVHDAHSAMAQLRGWRPPIGTTRTVYVVGGRRLWRVDVQYAALETIGSALGNRRAVRFEGKSYRVRNDLALESKTPARTFTVWLSDDADRVPLRVVAATELGNIVMALTEYTRP